MPPSSSSRVLAVVEDLFFTARISETARLAGLAVDFITDEQSLLNRAADNPPLIILDLNAASLQPLSLIPKLKAAGSQARILGFLSHVQTGLWKQAQEAGCDLVLPRSSFTKNLHQILRQYAG